MKHPKEVSEQLKETFKAFEESLHSYSEKEFEYKHSEEIWSLAQMYEHLYLSAIFFFMANINRCIEKRKGEYGKGPNDAGLFVMKQNAFPAKKFIRPGTGQTPEPSSKGLSFYQKNFAGILSQLLEKESLVSKDEGEYRTEHPVLGFLNAAEWYYNMEIHLRHHLRQKKELESYLPAPST